MKKVYLIISTIALVVFLSSCSVNKFEIKDRIKTPKNNLPPIEGKWTMDKFIDSPYKKGEVENSENLMGKEALFHKSAIVIGENYAIEPTYRLKNVKLADYLLYKYKIEPKELGISDDNAQIITIYSNDQYFHEFIKYNNSEMITFIDDRFYFLKKSVDQISKEEIDRYINIEESIMRISNTEEVDTLRSGILLGIKSHFYDETNQLANWEYKTIWIRANNRSIASIYEMDNLLVPRKKGFWLVNVERENIDNSLNDKIKAIQKGDIKEEFLDNREAYSFGTFLESKAKTLYPSILKNILYIGNDYISTELIDLSNGKRNLKVYPIDHLEDERPIKISDIIGQEGLSVFKEGAQNAIKTNSNILLDEESFGLARRNGYWIMKGRINYKSDDEEYYKDYNIKTIPPKELVNYDKLTIPWSIVKSKVPEAIDAFTSPNEDIIIIVTRRNLLLYSINNNEISQNEIGRIKMDNSETVVMAEWATGRYTMLWEEEFLKNETEVIKY
ncbi:hypothetical protein SAMN02745784_00037 [Tissierella praeacuta DSM 18095]|uniref:Lipoprotein n=1 Tax=Tissierella praeacuta DSM 18095 TaxID=1123404 RepID=A0A1M4S566_9FIRM|nr:hypothetical protein [Tissierella praeacuta]TCU71597.1 hypothetical protein EV204_10659 [Tissierella praeacuta]SHE27348.1 hypothetical protein SAMN02745784_00037 [Tissierella praeacuta DSM 18095]SUP00871.1 Uncharacterised protein [Tissierella praeacuta]